MVWLKELDNISNAYKTAVNAIIPYNNFLGGLQMRDVRISDPKAKEERAFI
jgi:hypothetical protein